MTRNLRTSEDKADYARRAAIVEPVFGQMKVAKGAGPFRLRGQDQARPEGEWTLHVFRHTCLTLQRAARRPGRRGIPALPGWVERPGRAGRHRTLLAITVTSTGSTFTLPGQVVPARVRSQAPVAAAAPAAPAAVPAAAAPETSAARLPATGPGATLPLAALVLLGVAVLLRGARCV